MITAPPTGGSLRKRAPDGRRCRQGCAARDRPERSKAGSRSRSSPQAEAEPQHYLPYFEAFGRDARLATTDPAVLAEPGGARRWICDHLFSATPAVAAPVVTGLFVVVAALDLLSPRYNTFGAFYLVVVVYATWASGRRAGWLSAAAVTAAALLSDGFGGYVALATGQARAVAIVWSLVMRLLSFAAIIELVRGFRHSFEHARRLGETDALTGLLDRRAFRAAAARLLARSHAAGRVGIVLYADLDGFKQANDRLGHAAGDEALAQCAALLRNALATGDLICRAGGDEFVACIEVATEALGRQTVLHLRRELNDGLARFRHGALSCSIGAALARADEPLPDVDTLIARADGLMYEAKQSRFTQLATGTG